VRIVGCERRRCELFGVRLEGLGSVMSSPSRVLDSAPAASDFLLCTDKISADFPLLMRKHTAAEKDKSGTPSPKQDKWVSLENCH